MRVTATALRGDARQQKQKRLLTVRVSLLLHNLSEADLLSQKLISVLLVDVQLVDGTHFLRLNHLNAVALLVDQKASFLAFKGLCVLIRLPELLVLLHLGVKLMFIC